MNPGENQSRLRSSPSSAFFLFLTFVVRFGGLMASKKGGNGDYDSEEERRWKKWGKRFGGRMRDFGEEASEKV